MSYFANRHKELTPKKMIIKTINKALSVICWMSEYAVDQSQLRSHHNSVFADFSLQLKLKLHI